MFGMFPGAGVASSQPMTYPGQRAGTAMPGFQPQRMPAATPPQQPAAPITPPPAPVPPPQPQTPPAAGQPPATPATPPAPHGLAADGRLGASNIQGILGGLGMMAPGAASNPQAMQGLAASFGNLKGSPLASSIGGWFK